MSFTDEKAKFKYKTPRQTKFTDLIERVGEASGGQVDIANEDVISTLFGADQYGDQTSQFSLGVGSNPDLDKYYRLTMTNNTRTGRLTTRIVNMVQFTMNGNVFEKSESGHHMNPWTADILSHVGYPEGADMMIVKVAD